MKSMNKKRFMFPPITDKSKLEDLKIDRDSYDLITYPNAASQITKIIINNLHECHLNPNDVIITEMTAGVGGNVINFAFNFPHVNAIEINQLRYDYLVNNINIYNLTNVTCYHGNSYDLVLKDKIVKQNVIFFDPPWGGKMYKSLNNLLLNFNDVPIEQVVKEAFDIDTRMMVIKMPNNYNFTIFNEYVSRLNVAFYKYFLKGMTIVVIINQAN